MKIPIIIPCYYSKHLIDSLIKSIELETTQSYELIFIDNYDLNEEEQTLPEICFKKYQVISTDKQHYNNPNWLYSKSVNKAFETITHDSDKFIILNPDCQPREVDWLTKMLNYWNDIKKFDENIVTLGTLQLRENDTVWHFGTFWKGEKDKCHPLDWRHNQFYQNQKYINVDGNTGTGIMIDCNKFKELGMYNEKDYPHYSSDADFCLRATKKGYKHYCCNVIFKHEPGTSTKKD